MTKWFNMWKWIKEVLIAFTSFISLENHSEFSISWKTFKSILFWRRSANKTGKTVLRSIFPISPFSPIKTAVLITEERKPWGEKDKKKKPSNPQNS